jgi:two-component system NtrC family sensor kinase
VAVTPLSEQPLSAEPPTKPTVPVAPSSVEPKVAERSRPRWRFTSLRWQFTLPYILLTLLVAAAGTFIIVRLVSSSVRERFDNNLSSSSAGMATGFVQRESLHLAQLRQLAFTTGVAEALENSDAIILEGLLTPTVLNDRIEVVTVVNRRGTEVLSLILNDAANDVATSFGVELGNEPLVQAALAGQEDETGDKFAGVRTLANGTFLFASAPVRDASNQIVGAILVGSRFNNLLTTLSVQSLAQAALVFDLEGNVIARTFDERATDPESLRLSADEMAQLTALPIDAKRVVRKPTVTLDEIPYEFIFTPFLVRGRPAGVLGVALQSDYVVNTEVSSRSQFAIIFTIATLGVLAVGYWLATNTASPILKLRGAAQAVAGGDLTQKANIQRPDEIGELAVAFDSMTDSLRERTAQAARLQAETAQRNRELASINSRLQSAQQQLVQSEKLASVGQLTAGIVHDVKNPLAVIKGLAEILQEENVDEFAREQLTLIRDNAARANTIVSDLLTFARQSTPEMKQRDLRETLQAALRLTEYLVRRGRVNASLDLPAEPVLVMYDAQQIEQVIVNLIQNAVQAMPGGGSLTLSLGADENQATLRARDTGVGIAPENLRRVFDPFFTTKEEGEGTGLGLSVSYGIVARHHGDIQVESTIGQGTTFTITLPLTQPQVEPTEGEVKE